MDKMEFKRKCFLGHKPDKIKEGKLAYKKRMEGMKVLASSVGAIGVEEAAVEGPGNPSPLAIPSHTHTLHHNDAGR